MDTRKRLTSGACGALTAMLLGGSAQAQIFVRNSSDVPDQTGNVNRFTENVDFGDVDLDGDWDAALSKGGDFGNLQNQLWINMGGIQGGNLGTMRNSTSTQFPVQTRDGRDIEFVDFDSDGDLDIYNSNTSTNSNQSNTWWANQGGLQGGSLAFYVDESATRWIGLGGAGSSISPGLLIGTGFIDWSCDCDFGDLDNDGDMDLVHSTYGGGFNGQVPTRIFRNDSLGHFSEFNPSGFQLLGSSIVAGNPGLWCEGIFQSNTSNTTGVNCDIATNTLDIDVGDVDGDFDLDILHGDRNSNPRFFYNRLQENGGTPGDLGFRDVTNHVYPPGYASGTGHYEQELGDFDGDDDLDVYGLNWSAGGFGGLEDITIRNDSTGKFTSLAILGGSGSDDNEGDFGDYDNDGDLDLYVANFSGTDRLYDNNGSGTLTLVSTAASGLGAHGLGGYSSLDADWGDVDGDGDYDVISAQDGGNPSVYWENMTQTPDTTGPRVSKVEGLTDEDAGINGDPDRVVRAHVFDNAAYYVTWYNPTEVVLEVEGVEIERIAAQSSGGQVFRALIPSNLVGNVAYRFESEDHYGNGGVSATETYVASEGARTNEIVYGTPFIGTLGFEYEVHSRALLTAGKRWYTVVDTKGAPAFFILSISLSPSAPIPDPLLGVVNIGASFLNQFGVTDPAGFRVKKFDIPSDTTGVFSIFQQIFVLEPSLTTWSSSKGVEVPFYQ